MGKMRKKNRKDLTWSKKRRDKSQEIDLFSNIPRELILEILLKLPAKSIFNLSFVSKHWSSIIRDKDFTELYLTRSFTRPRLLFAVNRRDMHFLVSRSLEDPSSDHHHRVTITPKPDSRYWFSSPVRGLICCFNGTKVLIGNPSTGQLVTLPRVRTIKNSYHLFLGYDPVNDLYKVLCMTDRRVPFRDRFFRVVETEEHQVLTLGAKQEWRMIECKHGHRLGGCPESRGICIDGVVYYLAKVAMRNQSVISFNLRSEQFNVIEFPKVIKHVTRSGKLVNYGGKIAYTDTISRGILDLWVLMDVSNQEWLKSSLLLPSWINSVWVNEWFTLRGALRTGELIFVPFFYKKTKPFSYICYDLKANHGRKVVIEELGDDYRAINVFLDHAESPIFLPTVC